jgi:hypothetical protein
MAEMDLSMALLRGAASALAVAALLWAARRWGRGLAGLLAGLPTVTGPAMVWLAVDRGGEFAAQAGHGAVLAALPCGLFAVTYAVLAQRHGRVASLLAATALCALPLPLLLQPGWPMAGCLLLAAAASLGCVRLIPRQALRVLPPAGARSGAAAAACTVLATGTVSMLCSLLAPVLPPLWVGALTSPPLLAAAVVWTLHGQGCPGRVQDFLRGYTAGLLGRSVFVALFGSLLVQHGLGQALCAAVVCALALGLLAHVWMRRRGGLAMMPPAPP